ncbi:cilia- and flagella-associated protein 43-like isoform X2 [Centruroides sculpturatus]|uniref:cilia- and flagella-associated protein 43-like isoform X2 n=1 Tax=Centruroides sculpturatus TaxID=218467 RepID=UPI000C6E90D9|nr:cilia- and flagella-associated protein 43-like isoform X2 [Centruroides sculpturatus]
MENFLKHSWIQGGCNNIPSFIDDDNICFPCGSFIKLFNMKEGTETNISSPGDGISFLTSNELLNVIAIAELTIMPNIYIMQYPSFQIIGILKNGATLEYLYLEFVFDEKLISLGGIPDFKLTIWKWTTQEVLCTMENYLPSYVLSKTPPLVQISMNPLTYKKICMTYPEKLIFFEVEQFANDFVMNKCSCMLPVENETEVISYSSNGEFPKLDLFLQIDNLDSKNMLIKSLVQVPLSASTGMSDDSLQDFLNHTYGKYQVIPTCHCWLNDGSVLVSCKDGSILQVNSENYSVKKIYSVIWPHFQEDQDDVGPVISMALHAVGLYLAGRGGLIMIMKMKEQALEMLYSFNINQTVGNINFSLSYQRMCIWGIQGSIYILDMAKSFSNNPVNVWNKNLQNIVGVGCFGNIETHCIIVREDGIVQLWNLENGSLRMEFNIGQNATDLACSPLCSLLVVATTLGFLYFYDLSEFALQKRRLIKILRLFTEPILSVNFDNNGEYLVVVGRNNILYVLGGSPSRLFDVCGYIVMDGEVMDVTLMSDSKDLHILTLSCGKTNSKERGGDILNYMSIPLSISLDPEEYWKGNSKEFNLQAINFLKPQLEKFGFGLVIHPNSDVYSFCAENPFWLQKFQMLKKDHSQNIIKPSCFIESGHSLKGSLAFSHNYNILATLSDDGTLAIRDVESLKVMQIVKTHHYWKGKRGKELCFSSDDSKIIVIGEDYTIVCYKIENFETQVNEHERKELIESLYKADSGKSSSETLSEMQIKQNNENAKLCNFQTITRKETEKEYLINKKQLEIQKFSEEKSRICSEVVGLQLQLEELMENNELLPEQDRLPFNEFVFEPAEIEKLQSQIQMKMDHIKEELQESYLKLKKNIEILKTECWDNMEEKGICLWGFYSNVKVENYPLPKQPEKELIELEQIKWSREMENLIYEVRINEKIQESMKKKTKIDNDGLYSTYSEIPADEKWSGSQRLECEIDYPLLYNQFQLLTMKQKIDQIVLLKVNIFYVKCSNLIVLFSTFHV